MRFHSGNTLPIISDDITASQADTLFREIRNKGYRNVFIDSPGGSVYTMKTALDNLPSRNMTVIAGGYVGSAALDIYLCGTRRLALPDSTFMFHRCNVSFDGRIVQAGELQQLARIARADKNWGAYRKMLELLSMLTEVDRITAEFIASRTRLYSQAVMWLMGGGDVELTAQQALYYGLVHEIISEDRVAF
jgi:ATP-dependent protease ClpP protease subunit